jgi:signal transduction histidine kinase
MMSVGLMIGLFAVVAIGYALSRYRWLPGAAPPETEKDRQHRLAASEEMKRMNMAAAFPLVSQGELLGYLLLGEKMSEEAYSKEDLLLLRIVANQAALAYQRVRYLEMAVHGARTEMLGEVAGGFAHEIKTPLTNISLPAELSMMDLIDVEKGQKRMEDIVPELKNRMRDIMHQTMKASEKIEAIRQFSKPGPVQLEAVDLSAIVQNSLGLLDHLLKKTNTRVRTEFPSAMAPIQGDAKQLEIVFVNLIKNAAEAMTQHASRGLARELWLKGHEDANWVVATIKDSGPGIKRTDIGHLFEAYFTTKGSDGTGMGLFLSRQVIKAHGGSIDVKTEEGKGTEFIIRLPKYLGQDQSRVDHEAA